PDPHAPNNKLKILARAKANLHEVQDIELCDIPKRFLPDHYYSTILGNTQFFHLNTNTLIKDFLHSEDNTSEYETQLEWLVSEYQKAKEAGRTIFYALHNPVYTCGKRSVPGHYDAHLYLQAELSNR